MAIYHLNAKLVSRGKGQSLVGSVAYGCRGKMVDERTGTTHQYSAKPGEEVHSFVSLPEGAKAGWGDPEALANEIELFEDRLAEKRFRVDQNDPLKAAKSLLAKEQFINSAQTAQSLIVALRKDVSREQQIASVELFVEEVFQSRNLPAITSIHFEDGNPHAHIKIGRREVLNGEFSTSKDRWIVSKEGLGYIRSEWARCDNEVARSYGDFEKIDHRSYLDREIPLIPTTHEGWYSRYIEGKGDVSRIAKENDVALVSNAEAIKENPELLIDQLLSEESVFSRDQLATRLQYRFMADDGLMNLHGDMLGLEDGHVFREDDAKAAGVHWANRYVKSDALEIVGYCPKGDVLYATKQTIANESELLADMKALKAQRAYGRVFNRVISDGRIDKQIARFNKGSEFKLSDEQSQAIHYLCGDGSHMRVLQGAAGSGKTKILSQVADLYRGNGYSVFGASFQASAVQVLRGDIGGECRTLDSLKNSWEKGYSLLSKKDLLIVDESNMVSSQLLKPVFDEVKRSGAQLILVGDSGQILSRGRGDMFRHAKSIAGYSELTQIVRQGEGWMKDASSAFASHDVEKGFGAYHDRGHLAFHDNAATVRGAVAREVVSQVSELSDLKSILVTSYRNRTVSELNDSIREELVRCGKLKGVVGFELHGKSFIPGDRILFTKNENRGNKVLNMDPKDNMAGVRNGDLGSIVAYDMRANKVFAKLDNGRAVHFNPHEFTDVMHGYAMTVNKSEGRTVDKHILVMDRLMSANKSYVACTRHRESLSIHVDRHDASDFASLVRQVGFSEFKYSTLDLKKEIPYGQRQVLERYLSAADGLREAYISSANAVEGKPYELISELESRKQVAAQEILTGWKVFEPHCLALRLRRDWIEVDAGMRDKLVHLTAIDEGRHALIKDYVGAGNGYQKLLKGYELHSALSYSSGQGVNGETYSLLGVNHIARRDLEVANKLYQTNKLGQRPGAPDAFDSEHKGAIYAHYLTYQGSNRALASAISEARLVENAKTQHVFETYLESINKEEGSSLRLSEFHASHAETHGDETSKAFSALHLSQSELKKIGYQIFDHYGHYDFGKISKDFYQTLLSSGKDDSSEISELRESLHASAATLTAQLAPPEANEFLGERYTKRLFEVRDAGLFTGAVQAVESSDLSARISGARQISYQLSDSPRRFSARLAASGPHMREQVQLLKALDGFKGDKGIAASQIDHYLESKRVFVDHLKALKPEDNLEVMRASCSLKNVRQNFWHNVESYKTSLNSSEDKRLFSHASKQALNEYLSRARESVSFESHKDEFKHCEAVFEASSDQELSIFVSMGFDKIKSHFAPIVEADKKLGTLMRQHQTEQFNGALYRARSIAAKALAQSDFGQLLQKNEKSAYQAIRSAVIDKKSLQVSKLVDSRGKDASERSIERQFVDVDAVKGQIADNAKEIATQLLGAPNPKLSNAQTLRFGNKGSLAVTISGDRSGMWHDFERGESGHLFNLAKSELGLSFKETLSHYGEYFGGGVLKKIERKASEVDSGKKALTEEQTAAKKQAKIDKIIKESKPLSGTIAERYLNNRHIGTKGLSDDLRFHEGIYDYGTKQKHPALVCIARDAKDQAKALQIISLDKDGQKADIDVVKRSQGSLKGSFVEAQKGDGSDKKLYVAEGPETAASIANARPGAKVLAALGLFNFKQLERYKDHHIVICADHDDPKQKVHAVGQVEKAMEHLKSQGVKVSVVKPEQMGHDFNDVLKHEGKSAVAHQLQAEQHSIHQTIQRDLSRGR